LPLMQTAIVFGVDSEGVVGTLAGPSSLLGNVSEHRTPVTVTRPGQPCFSQPLRQTSCPEWTTLVECRVDVAAATIHFFSPRDNFP